MHFHISPLPSTLILLAFASSLLAQPTPNPLEWIDFSLSRHFYPSIAAIPPPSGSSGGNTNHYCVAALDMGGVAYPLVQLTPTRTSFECRGGQSGTWRPRLVFRGLEGASFSVVAAVIEGKAEISPKGALGEVGVGIGYPVSGGLMLINIPANSNLTRPTTHHRHLLRSLTSELTTSVRDTAAGSMARLFRW